MSSNTSGRHTPLCLVELAQGIAAEQASASHVVENHVIVAVAVGLYDLQAMPRSQLQPLAVGHRANRQSVPGTGLGQPLLRTQQLPVQALDHPHRAFRLQAWQVRSDARTCTFGSRGHR